MPARKDIDGSVSIPAFYGKELRWKREAAGLTLQATVKGSFYAVSYLSEIERGQRLMPLRLACHVDQLLKTDGYFERCCKDVQKARKGAHAGYFTEIAQLEGNAKEIESWNPLLIPGPLQLEPYIRTVIRASDPLATEELIAARVSARRERSWIHEDPKSPESWIVLHESILRQPILGHDEMAEQLAHIVDVAQQRRFITQILPCNAGAHPFMMGATWLFTFDDAPPLMYSEGMYSGQTVDDPGLVKDYAKAYGRLRATALSPEASLKMIGQAAEEYGNGKRPR
ncbi:XRE family transcriptional regulator [Streptomyces kasugaensis]|uniref:XRE family transcriptional regulator n=1 Tax=Streptomyces kasugaensis TaxID=1946 RepID=A0A4V2JJB3_STRKA|nr:MULTISPECIES: helix-turn-helix transcriptional regulator [Streptomyces]MYU54974.1 XRE family transcriptional regulator [Streptomyces sp. SID7805]TBO61141.1 XRE family transcriptional regulator [Streptomyces kasugaensis]